MVFTLKLYKTDQNINQFQFTRCRLTLAPPTALTKVYFYRIGNRGLCTKNLIKLKKIGRIWLEIKFFGVTLDLIMQRLMIKS